MANFQTAFFTVSASQTNTNQAIGFPARRVTFENTGANNVFVNVANSGIAATTGVSNHLVRNGTSLTFQGGPGESVSVVGLICAVGETATVNIHATRQRG